MREGCWLPQIECCDDLSKWEPYQDFIYSIFKKDFIDSYPLYENVRVNVKHYPVEYGKVEAFFHTTCKDYDGSGERSPDLRRCERIRWIRAFIENKCDPTKCEDCDGIKTWREPYKSRIRVHILLEEEKYMVVLEHRPKTGEHEEFYLLITAFYLDYQHAMEKQLRHYRQFRDIDGDTNC